MVYYGLAYGMNAFGLASRPGIVPDEAQEIMDAYFDAVAMIRVDEALRQRPDLDCHMLLTVHDELVFEVAKEDLQEAADLVKDRMERAADLDVPLRADIGWGANWQDAAPEGH